MLRNLSAFAVAALALAACSKSSPDTLPEPEVIGVRVNNNLEAPISRGDCKEAVRRAALNPDIDVEKVPAPLAMTLSPIGTKKMPKGVADRNGWYHVKFHVLVDTSGKADMKTFAIDTTSHAWLATSVKSAVAKWKFAPAEIAGCKVPRHYSLGISPKNKTPAAVKKAPAKPAKKPAATKSTTTKKPPVSSAS